MNRITRVTWPASVCAALAGILVCSPAQAQPAADRVAKPAAEAGLPPLLDRELFFGNPEIAGAQLSPDGR
jgi:hypothetical protein